MNKKIFILFVILFVTSIVCVYAQSGDVVKSQPDYETNDFIEIQKTWVGDNESLRPSSVNIDIYADGTYLNSVTLSASDNWKLTYRLLTPVNNTDGSKIVYTFKENGVDNYTLSSVENADLDFTLTNQYTEKDNQTSNNQTSNNQTISNQTSNTNKTDNQTGNFVSQDKINNTIYNVVSSVNNVSKTVHNHTSPEDNNGTNKMLNTGNNIWIVIVCIIVIICAVIYKRRG